MRSSPKILKGDIVAWSWCQAPKKQQLRCEYISVSCVIRGSPSCKASTAQGPLHAAGRWKTARDMATITASGKFLRQGSKTNRRGPRCWSSSGGDKKGTGVESILWSHLGDLSLREIRCIKGIFTLLVERNSSNNIGSKSVSGKISRFQYPAKVGRKYSHYVRFSP